MPSAPSATPAEPAEHDPFASPRPPDAAARRSRAWVLGSVLALIALCLAWELWLAPTGSGTLAIKALPLFLPLAGLWRFRLYTYRWLSLMIWLYAGEGMLRATSERGAAVPLAILELVLSMIIFVGCVMHVRGRLRRKGELAAEAQG
ncbi:MAG: DUF2069 domain-containing protein [Rubrivivax sp.]|nr:DUF2069 domain-containing protein [Rubrivivax sp.]